MQFNKKLVLSLLAAIPCALATNDCHALGGQCIDVNSQQCSGYLIQNHCNGGGNIICCIL